MRRFVRVMLTQRRTDKEGSAWSAGVNDAVQGPRSLTFFYMVMACLPSAYVVGSHVAWWWAVQSMRIVDQLFSITYTLPNSTICFRECYGDSLKEEGVWRWGGGAGVG